MNGNRVEFLTELQMVYIGGGCYMLTAPFIFRVYLDGMIRVVTIPAGFVTDLHSVPWWLRWLFRCYVPGMNKSAVGHDYFYRFWKLLGISREYADRVYLMIALAETKGLSHDERLDLRRKAMLYARAVRRFGWMVIGKGDGTLHRGAQKALDNWKKQQQEV